MDDPISTGLVRSTGALLSYDSLDHVRPPYALFAATVECHVCPFQLGVASLLQPARTMPSFRARQFFFTTHEIDGAVPCASRRKCIGHWVSSIYSYMDWMDLYVRKFNVDLEMDWTRLEWTLVSHLPFGFGFRLRSSSTIRTFSFPAFS
jgi:hypothetical protein